MRFNCSAISALLIISFCLGLKEHAQAQQNERTISENAALRIPNRLPKLFDFQRFKQLYRRQYVSLTEELARQKLYLGRAFNVFISHVKYKWNSSKFYLAINNLSDWTKTELHSLALKPDDFLAQSDDSSLDEIIESSRTELDEVKNAEDDSASSLSDALDEPVAEPAEIEAQLELLVDETDLASQPGYKQIVEELVVGAKKRKRRDVSETISSNQANDEPRSRPGTASPKKPMPASEASLLSRLPGAHMIGRLIDNTAEEIVHVFKGIPKLPSKAPKSDGIHIDHRTSHCLTRPKDQKECGSCYAYAVVSLYEWIHCMNTGDLVEFSEQYIIECGQRVKGLKGCKSGKVSRVGSFTSRFGLELSASYDSPVKSRETSAAHQCPYDASANPKTMGYVRVHQAELRMVRMEEIDKRLNKTPIVVNLRLSANFNHFGGGIDDSLECGPEEGHAMLLIGKGEENGEEYYLLRNSYGVDYGLAGHYRMSRDAFYKCSHSTFGYYTKAYFDRSAKSGPHKRANREPIRQRRQEEKPRPIEKGDRDQLIERGQMIAEERQRREAELVKRGKKSFLSLLNDD